MKGKVIFVWQEARGWTFGDCPPDNWGYIYPTKAEAMSGACVHLDNSEFVEVRKVQSDWDFLAEFKISPDSDLLGIAMLADRRYRRRVAEAELVATFGGEDEDTEPSRLESLVAKGALIRFAPCECGGRRHVAPSGDWACFRCQRSGEGR